MRRFRATAVIALVAALLLAGCSDDEEPDGAEWPTPSTSASSVSPSPSESPIDLTVAPKGETAKEFIRRWLALGNQMLRTGDPEPFLSAAGPDCRSCKAYAKDIAAIYRKGGYVKGGDERAIAFTRESATQWVVIIESEPTEYARSADGEVESLPGGKYKTRIYLSKVYGAWSVSFQEELEL